MTRISSFAIACLLLFCYAACKNEPGNGKKIVLTNSLDIARPDALIIFTRRELQDKLGNLDGKFIHVKEEDEELVVQHDDLNSDGVWDEVAFVCSFKAKEKLVFFIESSSEVSATSTAIIRAHVRLRKKDASDVYGNVLQMDTMPKGLQANDFKTVPIPYYQTEGPAWENDKVAFRLYLDARNGKDIFGKTTATMMMDTVGVEGDIHYHQKADWGMDILKVGKSLGAGSLAFIIPVDGKDSLIRLGNDSVSRVVYERVADGPLRAICRIHYINWHPVAGVSADVTEEISIAAGQYFYESKVTAEHLPAGSKPVTGIVNIHSKVANTIDATDCHILYTYDKQSENADNLGMAIIFPGTNFNSFGQTSNDSMAAIQHTYSLVSNSASVSFRFYAGWEPSDKRFATEKSFADYIKYEGAFATNTIKIDW